ncbi:hypothetical protein TNCT_667121 [Trichonephila clavata]|uniref:Uncharacterized protein n=1 Tax=Trichonephila clavata TaxID=2740835 RepID=A0A8X6KY03_TRICU|nr:hypothetical protein TNCT_667121 [Trichonephila clavata]
MYPMAFVRIYESRLQWDVSKQCCKSLLPVLAVLTFSNELLMISRTNFNPITWKRIINADKYLKVIYHRCETSATCKTPLTRKKGQGITDTCLSYPQSPHPILKNRLLAILLAKEEILVKS